MATDDDPMKEPINPTATINFRRPPPRETSSLPTLRVVAGPDMLKFCSIYPSQSVRIGRDPGLELQLNSSPVSYLHATIRSDENANLIIEDLNSTNGTTVNGCPVTSPMPVNVGDSIDVGGVALRIDCLKLDELAHLARVHERLSLANKDPLTGLTTRHYINDELPDLMTDLQSRQIPLSVVFLDIDKFKAVNDSFGHSVGDDVLRCVARLMVLTVRDTDTCVRYGGEELLSILPNCDELGALQMAERLRNLIRETNWSHYNDALQVTASIGVAQHRPDETLEEMFERVDKAMYQAKRTGRDRTICASTLE